MIEKTTYIFEGSKRFDRTDKHNVSFQCAITMCSPLLYAAEWLYVLLGFMAKFNAFHFLFGLIANSAHLANSPDSQ